MTTTPRPDALARQLAEARHELATPAGAPPWLELGDRDRHNSVREAQHYLDAAARAGIAVAALSGSEDVGDRDQQPPTRTTAMIRDLDGQPIQRDAYADRLQADADRGRHQQRQAILSPPEATAVASLLDELAGVYSNEALGRLARELAVRIYDRLGI